MCGIAPWRGAIILVVNAPILVQNRTSGGQPVAEHPLPLSVSTTKSPSRPFLASLDPV
jgi:hypothetical protein